MVERIMKFMLYASLVLCLITSFVLLGSTVRQRLGHKSTQTAEVPAKTALQTSIDSMSNQVTEIGWRECLARGSDNVSDERYVVFSLNGTNGVANLRKAIWPFTNIGEDVDSSRTKNGGLEVYVVRITYRTPDTNMMDIYVVMVGAKTLRADR